MLISAPPGSGKENLALSIPYGTGRVATGEEPFILSLASGSKEESEKHLFGEEWPMEIAGLIYKAAGSVLFLDEAHHPENEEASVRPSLLRTFETGEYIPCGGKRPKKVNDVLFILATSRPLKSKSKIQGLADIRPIDFWTRMTHVVIVKHPFENIWAELPAVIQNFFVFFWWERLEKYYKIDPETEIDQENNKDSSLVRSDQMHKLKEEGKLINLAEVFYRRLHFILSQERVQPHELSIRGFRNIVTRIFSICAAQVAQGGAGCEIGQEKIDETIYEILDIAKLDPV